MAGFSELTKLLESDPGHRLVIVREDGTPMGVLIGIDEYQTMLQRKTGARNADEQKQHEEWDAMIEKVSGMENLKNEEDTYLFEPVE